MNDKPWFKIITLINRALLLCDDKDEAAILRYTLEMARTEAENLQERIDVNADQPAKGIRWQ